MEGQRKTGRQGAVTTKQAALAMAEAYWRTPEAGFDCATASDEVKALIVLCMENALAADPLRQKLGEEAVKAIMDGTAAVIPMHRMESGHEVMMLSVNYRYQDGCQGQVSIGECRLDKP